MALRSDTREQFQQIHVTYRTAVRVLHVDRSSIIHVVKLNRAFCFHSFCIQGSPTKAECNY